MRIFDFATNVRKTWHFYLVYTLLLDIRTVSWLSRQFFGYPDTFLIIRTVSTLTMFFWLWVTFVPKVFLSEMKVFKAWYVINTWIQIFLRGWPQRNWLNSCSLGSASWIPFCIFDVCISRLGLKITNNKGEYWYW